VYLVVVERRDFSRQTLVEDSTSVAGCDPDEELEEKDGRAGPWRRRG
jgi:hypothetical protein